MGFSSEVIDGSEILISWDPYPGAVSFDVQICSAPGVGCAAAPGSPLSGDAEGYEAEGLEPNTEYCFRVRVNTAEGTSAWSSYTCATTTGSGEFGAPVIDFVETNPGGNAATVEWGPVTDAINYEVTVTPPGGSPTVWENPVLPGFVLYAPGAGEYEVTVKAAEPGGNLSPSSEPEFIELVATPPFQEGAWDLNDIGDTNVIATLWHATTDGAILTHQYGDTTAAWVEYQLNEVGAPTLGTVHPDALPADEKIPIMRNSDGTMWFVRNDYGAEDAFLSLFDLSDDTYSMNVPLNWYPSSGTTARSYDAGTTFVNLAGTGSGTFYVDVVDMSDGSIASVGPIACDYISGGMVVAEGHVYIGGALASDECLFVIDILDPANPVSLGTVSWSFSGNLLTCGPGWALINTGQFFQMWDLSSPAVPTLLDSFDYTSVPDMTSIAGVYQLLNRHAVDVSLVAGGAISALVDGQMVIGGAGPPGAVPKYIGIDVSTPMARANIALTVLGENAAWGECLPFAALGAVQTVGAVHQDDYAKKWIFVSDFPPSVAPPEAP